MAPLDGYLKDPEYSNWVKCGLALNITNEVLRPFVVKEITELHQSIVKKLPSGVSCGGCRVNTGCPNCICDKIQREIEIQHWYGKPSFTNTCTGRWSTGPWEIAKCYMPPSKGSRCSSDSDADFTASINVIINCKHFQAFGTNDPNGTPESNLSKSRDFRNSIMHASPQKVSNHYMKENLDILINIINMVKAPETKAEVEKSIKGIEKIKTNQLVLKLEDVIEVRKNATEAIADKTEKDSEQVQRERLLVNFEAGCRKALCRLTEEYISKQEENLSVADFLSSIRFLAVVKNLCQRHQKMLFPKYGSHADIREWDLFVYCFILEELDLHEAIGNAVFLFVQEVKKIREKLLLDATGVTQNDLSELCEYVIDTDLNTDITDIFNKDSPDVDVIRSNNTLVSWWREEEDYGHKQVSKKQLNITKQTMKELHERIQKNEKRVAELEDKVKRLPEKSEHGEVDMPLQESYGSKIGADCNLEVKGCDRVTKEALQENITYPNNNDIKEPLKHACNKLNLLEVKPVKGSIVLKVTCSSITNVIDFWDSCIDGRAVEALSELRDYYRQYFKCDTLEFDVILSKKGVFRCVNEIGEGLSSHFEGLVDKVTQKVNKISKAKDEDLITGSVEILTFGDEGGDDQASLAETHLLDWPLLIDDKREEKEIKQEEQIEELEELISKLETAERITFEEIPTMSENRRFQTKRKEEGINQKKRSKYMPSLDRFRRIFSRRRKTEEKKLQDKQLIPGSDTDSTGDEGESGFMSMNPLRTWLMISRGLAGIHQKKQIKDKQLIPGSDTDSTAVEGGSGILTMNPLRTWLMISRGLAGIHQKKQIEDKQLIPGSYTDSTVVEGGSGILTMNPLRTWLMNSRGLAGIHQNKQPEVYHSLSSLRRISTRGEARIHEKNQIEETTFFDLIIDDKTEEKEIKQEEGIEGYSYLGPTMVMEEPHPSSKDPINNPNALTADEILEYSNRLVIVNQYPRIERIAEHHRTPYRSISRDIGMNPSEKDLISKSQQRVPTTSKTEFDKQKAETPSDGTWV